MENRQWLFWKKIKELRANANKMIKVTPTNPVRKQPFLNKVEKVVKNSKVAIPAALTIAGYGGYRYAKSRSVNESKLIDTLLNVLKEG